MDLVQDPGNATYRIERYTEEMIQISGKQYHDSLVVMPETLVHPWSVKSCSEISPATMEKILELKPQIVLVGTGSKLIFPSQKALAPLISHGIGYEIMDTAAACRTYTVLMSEGRNVLAMLLNK